jgi:hypothetical protein
MKRYPISEVYMNKIFITNQQIELLQDAYKSTLGTPDYTKYSCEWSFKNKKTGQWKFSVWGSPCPYEKAYFKKMNGETYLYSMDGDERIKLNEACKELLEIN